MITNNSYRFSTMSTLIGYLWIDCIYIQEFFFQEYPQPIPITIEITLLHIGRCLILLLRISFAQPEIIRDHIGILKDRALSFIWFLPKTMGKQRLVRACGIQRKTKGKPRIFREMELQFGKLKIPNTMIAKYLKLFGIFVFYYRWSLFLNSNSRSMS